MIYGIEVEILKMHPGISVYQYGSFLEKDITSGLLLLRLI
jgi:hypothetical protein